MATKTTAWLAAIALGAAVFAACGGGSSNQPTGTGGGAGSAAAGASGGSSSSGGAGASGAGGSSAGVGGTAMPAGRGGSSNAGTGGSSGAGTSGSAGSGGGGAGGGGTAGISGSAGRGGSGGRGGSIGPGMGGGGGSANGGNGGSNATACTRELLRSTITAYFTALAAHSSSTLPLAANVKFTENGKVMALGEGLWRTAGAVKYSQSALDVESCSSATHAVVPEGSMDIPVALRLKLQNQMITEIETIAVRPGDYKLSATFASNTGAIIAANNTVMWEMSPGSRAADARRAHRLIDKYFRMFPSGVCNTSQRAAGAWRTATGTFNCTDGGASCAAGQPTGTAGQPRASILADPTPASASAYHVHGEHRHAPVQDVRRSGLRRARHPGRRHQLWLGVSRRSGPAAGLALAQRPGRRRWKLDCSMNRARVLSMTVLAATLYGTACSDGGGVVVDASADRSSPLDGADAADATNDHAPMPDAPTPDAPDDHAPMPDAPTPDVTDDHAPMPDAPTPDAPTSDAPDDHAPTPDAPTPDAGAIAEWAVLVHDDSNDDIYAIATFPDRVVNRVGIDPSTRYARRCADDARRLPDAAQRRRDAGLDADRTRTVGQEPGRARGWHLRGRRIFPGLSVVFGRGEPNETTLPGTASGPDFYLARYKGDGTLVWANRAAVNAPWQVSKIDAAADGWCS